MDPHFPPHQIYICIPQCAMQGLSYHPVMAGLASIHDLGLLAYII